MFCVKYIFMAKVNFWGGFFKKTCKIIKQEENCKVDRPLKTTSAQSMFVESWLKLREFNYFEINWGSLYIRTSKAYKKYEHQV
jgi:hypothetical protein